MGKHTALRTTSKSRTAFWVALISAFAFAVAAAGGAYAAHTLRRSTPDTPGAAATTTPAAPSVGSASAEATPTSGTSGNRTGATRGHSANAKTPHAARDSQGTASGAPTANAGAQLAAHYVFPIADCTATYGATHHDYPAADMFAARDCLFIAPVDGRIDEVALDDTWSPATNAGEDRGGRSVSLIGVDGVRYYGSHLEEVLPGIQPGLEVKAGTPLGKVGDSGSAAGTGTHLHFAISWPTPAGYWWIRRGTVYPQPYLDSWRTGGQASPVAAITRAEAAYGDDSSCAAYC